MELSHRTVECRAKRTFRISQSANDRFRMVICEIRHGDLVGYGESAPTRRVTGETVESVGAFLDDAAAALRDVAPADWERHLDAMHADPSAGPSARAALDIAMHDLVARSRGIPVRALYGFPAARLETCMTVSLDEPDVMAQEARGYREAGFRVLKLKLGKAEGDPARVAAVRAACPDARIRADANTGWSPEEASRITAALAKAGIEFVEQPFLPAMDDALARFSHESPLPLYADESVKDVHDVRRLHALGFRGGVNLKLQKTGGIRPAIAAIREARARGYQVQLGCNVETAVGIAAGVQLLGALDHADLDGHLLLRDMPFLGPMPHDGWYTTPEAPGLGVRPAD